MTSGRDKPIKAQYTSPTLTKFGSVRNLTGGSGNQASDALGGMSMMEMRGFS